MKGHYSFHRKSWQLTFTESILKSFARRLKLYGILSFIQASPILLYLVGTVFAFIIYSLSIDQVNILPSSMRRMLLSLLLLIMSSSFYFMPSASKCLSTLVVFNILVSACKLLLASIIFENIISGPIGNSIKNVNQIIDSLKCHYEVMKDWNTALQEKDISFKNKIINEIR